MSSVGRDGREARVESHMDLITIEGEFFRCVQAFREVLGWM